MRYLKILALLIIVGILVTQTNVVANFLKPKTAYAVGDLTVDWGIGVGDVGAIFTVNNIAPGDDEDENVIVTNNAATGRPVAIKGVLTSETGSLSTVMDITITDGVTTLYSNTLSQFFTDSLNPDGISLLTLDPSEAVTLNMRVTFQEGAGNEFQEKDVTFNLVIGIGIDVPAECESLLPPGKFPIFGTDDNDTIRGTLKNDVIFALEGNDRVDGNGGNDCIVGGDGNDELRGGNGDDKIFGNDGTDLLNGGNGKDVIFGGTGGDTIVGGNGNDALSGDDGNDSISGGNENDVIHGGDDDDTMAGGNGKDNLQGDLGTDSANGQLGKDTCDAETEIRCEL